MRKGQMVLPAEYVAGCDEVGRGPLAGPVVAAAVVLTQAFYRLPLLHFLRDSKHLPEAKRRFVAAALHQLSMQGTPSVFYSIASVGAEEIDHINIRQASLLAMLRALHRLQQAVPQKPRLILVDGRDALPSEACKTLPLTKGDSFQSAIQAASILAKVVRDDIMCVLDTRYPGYGFAKHKGYGTQQHLKALRMQGATPAHRRSFAPVKGMISPKYCPAA